MIRNLLYSVFATYWSDEWRLNVERLNQYADVFNGRKLVIVRTDANTVLPSVVEKAFTFPVEFRHTTNDPLRWESHLFLGTLGELYSLREDEITFYAHTKAVRHKGPADFIRWIRIWRNRMYDECLGDLTRVEKVMETAACAGCYRTIEFKEPYTPAWFFAGTYWWLNHAKLFSANWQPAMLKPHDIEAYPSKVFSRKDSACFYGDDAAIREIAEEILDMYPKVYCPNCKAPCRPNAKEYTCRICKILFLVP